MPIDPRIPLGVQPPQPGPSPFEVYGQFAQLQALRQQTQDAARKQQREAQLDAALRAAMVLGPDGEPTMDYSKLLGKIPGIDILAVKSKMAEANKIILDARTSSLAYEDKKRLTTAAIARGIAAGNYHPALYGPAVRALQHMGALTAEQADQALAVQDPADIKRVVDAAIAMGQDKPPEGFTLPPGQTRYDAQGKPLATAPEAAFTLTPGQTRYGPGGQVIASQPKEVEHSPIFKEWQDYRSQGGTADFNSYQTEDANRRAVRINTGQANDQEIDDYISGMVDGTLPPIMPGRASPTYTKIMAAVHRRGFDLASAATDWAATQKHIATLNGAQQTRLSQAINALPDMLDSVGALARQWKAGRFPALTRRQLDLAKGGALGPQAALIATQLEAQIADVVADLGNVYMGGNSPTDHALGLAGKSLSADWSEPVLLQMVELAKKNVEIRKHSMANVGVAGASADNPYAPPPAPGPQPTSPLKNPFR